MVMLPLHESARVECREVSYDNTVPELTARTSEARAPFLRGLAGADDYQSDRQTPIDLSEYATLVHHK
eukprot:2256483-Pyramimonas_sp.AAC.1